MPDLSALSELLIAALLGVLGYLLHAAKTVVEKAATTTADELSKLAVRERAWPADLARELQKTRGVERQGLRYRSYGRLWSRLEPLAIYDDAVFDRRAAGDLSRCLTEWYFSEHGGLMLTPQARDFFFALQDLLRATCSTPDDWRAVRPDPSGDPLLTIRGPEDSAAVRLDPPDDPVQAIFSQMGERLHIDEVKAVLEFLKESALPKDWQQEAAAQGKQWKKGVKKIGAAWEQWSETERFAALQQVSSTLRTVLAADLDSRLR